MIESRLKDNPLGPIVALDLGQKRVGVAVSDSNLISITKLPVLTRSNWKRLLNDVTELVRRFDARSLVIGLPLSLEGTEGSAALEARRIAEKFALSLGISVYLQDERLTSAEAEDQLRAAGYTASEIPGLVDGQSAAIILSDFMSMGQPRILVSPT
jgi:putative Holliday junction resolvase